MTRIRALILVLALLPASPAAAVSGGEIVRNATDGAIRPAYHRLHERAQAQSAAVAALCATPSQSNLDAARAAFSDAVDAWSAIEIVRFGPITERNRLERMLYWPDRKSIGLKQVQAALADKDPTASEAATLAGKSVAMQGFGALEFILFGTGADALAAPSDPYRCAYGRAVAGNVETIARDVAAEWDAPDGFAHVWATPGPQNPLYRDGTEAVTELMDVFVTGTELVRDVRLGGFLGETAAQDRPKQALFWRSGKTVDALAANLAGMQALLHASRLTDALPADFAFLSGSADFEFGNAAKAAADASGPIEDVLADADRRGKLVYFGLVTSSLSDIFGTQMSGALGLTAGFSSLDGD